MAGLRAKRLKYERIFKMAQLVFATGGFHGTSYCKEDDFGVIPDTPEMRGLRHTSNSMILSKDTFQSDELRSDAQISDLRHGNKQASGDIGIEFSYQEYDDFLVAAIRAVGWQTDVNTGDDYIVAGTKMTSFLIQRVFNDIGQYEYFTGCEVNSLSLNIETNAMVTGTINFVGKDIGFTTASLDPDPNPSFTDSPFDGFKGQLIEGGAPIAVVTSLELSIENSIEAAFVIGSDSAGALTAGRINITGTISAYFANMDLLKKFVDEEETSIVFMLGDGARKSYRFTLPRVKYSGGDNPVDGEGPVTLSMPFQALYDECTKTNIRIDKIAGPAIQDCELTFSSLAFNERAVDAKEIDTVITVTLSGGEGNKTFNGAIDAEVPGITWAGLPAGLAGSAKKLTSQTVELSIKGTADAAIANANITVTFTESAIAFGYCHCPNDVILNNPQVMQIVKAV